MKCYLAEFHLNKHFSYMGLPMCCAYLSAPTSTSIKKTNKCLDKQTEAKNKETNMQQAKTRKSQYLGNGTSDHRNEKGRPLFNIKYSPKPGKIHLRMHFWPLESSFLAIASYKTAVFLRIPSLPNLLIFLVDWGGIFDIFWPLTPPPVNLFSVQGRCVWHLF